MKAHDKRIIHSSSSAAWRTPPGMFAALDLEFHFSIDAAATQNDALVPDCYIGPDHEDKGQRDALACSWVAAHGPTRFLSAVFINPPYSRDLYAKTKNRSMLIAEWAMKCAHEGQRITVVGIFPASTQTKWWAEFIRNGPMKAREIRSIPHRVSFLKPDGSKANNAGGNTAVIIWTPNPGYVGDWQPADRVWTWRGAA